MNPEINMTKMMNPDMMKAAAEMMKNMQPEDMDRIARQMQSIPPDQMQRMMQGQGAGPPGMSPTVAADMMKNMRPEDLQFMARQLQGMPPEQLQQMMGSAGAAPGAYNPAAMSGAAQVLQQRQKYELDAAKRLKEEGNKLHGAGNYREAAEKYSRARGNLAAHVTLEASTVTRACTLNLMSCYLKLERHAEVIKLGDEVVAKDSRNLKALYRRGQAHLKLGNYQAAVADLREAAVLSPDDETLAGVLREAEEGLAKVQEKRRVDLDAIEDDAPDGTADDESTKSVAGSSVAPDDDLKGEGGGVMIEDVTEEEERKASVVGAAASVPAVPPTLDSAAALRSIEMMKSLPPEQVAAMSGGTISVDMARMASQMVSGMPPDELQRMMELATRFGPLPGAAAPAAASFQPPPPSMATGPTITSSRAGPAPADRVASGSASRSVASPSPSSGVPAAGPGGLPMGARMDDPEMMKAMAKMMENIPPEQLAAMSEQMGMPMSVEQARQTKEIMSKVGPERLATLMKWSSTTRNFWMQIRQALLWLVHRPAILLAILALIIAVVGRWLKYF